MAEVSRQSVDVDVVCVGFGPATAGFLTTLSRAVVGPDGAVRLESRVSPGMPLQVVCYERADDIAFGVSGVATRARGLRASLGELPFEEISLAAPIREEHLVYLFDCTGAGRRSAVLRAADSVLRRFPGLPGRNHEAWDLPYIPSFLRKDGGYVLSIGQFLQWVGNRLMAEGQVMVWPGTPVREPLLEQNRVVGVRLVDQGVDKSGTPTSSYLPGMDVHASLTVVGDGPVGPVSRRLDEHFGMPPGHHRTEWAVGAKMVVELPEPIGLPEGTVVHTFGYPEPEIFGFFYVHTEAIVSVGIFVPSWFLNPVRTSYRYLQYYMQHPYLWRYLKNGKLRSWGAKSLLESGRRGEPYLVGDGYARIGESSGTTNILTGSGVDEAWTSGVLLAESVVELLEKGLDFTRENLEATYVERRRGSWLEEEGRIGERARDGFTRGFVTGLMGMGLTGLSRGKVFVPAAKRPPTERMPTVEEYFEGRLTPQEVEAARKEAEARNLPLHDLLMERAGWPPVRYDGKLLVSQQDALLIGGKVQAPGGFADHVAFLYPELCRKCRRRICVEMCSGRAIYQDEKVGVAFDREKCVHCGACLWNCTDPQPGRLSNIDFQAGPGGLHSAEN